MIEGEQYGQGAQGNPQDYGIRLNPMTGNNDVMRWWLDTEPSVQKFELVLRGFKQDFRTGEWVYQDGQEWLGETGVNKVIGSVMNFLDANAILSDLREDRIESEVYYFKKKLIKLLAMQEIEFKMDVNVYGSMVVKNCGSIVYFALRRANKFVTAKALSSNTNVVEQNILKSSNDGSPNQERKGSFLSFLPFNRRT